MSHLELRNLADTHHLSAQPSVELAAGIRVETVVLRTGNPVAASKEK